MKQNNKKILIIILGLITIPVLGFKIYLEVDNSVHNDNIEQMAKNNELNSSIESLIEQNILQMDGYEVHYNISGNGNDDLIIFLHPAFSDHRIFDLQIGYFSKHYKVITIDLIGHGLSKA